MIGALNFETDPCPTLSAYATGNLQFSKYVIAFTDYYGYPTAWWCPPYMCGTKSILINTRVSWSMSPGPGQYDLASMLAHEFGHVLGFAHVIGNYCQETTGSPCVVDIERNTMELNNPSPGYLETCGRTPSYDDKANANMLYWVPSVEGRGCGRPLARPLRRLAMAVKRCCRFRRCVDAAPSETSSPGRTCGSPRISFMS